MDGPCEKPQTAHPQDTQRLMVDAQTPKLNGQSVEKKMLSCWTDNKNLLGFELSRVLFADFYKKLG